MRVSVRHRATRFGVLCLAFLSLAVLAACKGKKVEPAQAVVNAEEIRVDDLKPILGESADDASGVTDCTEGDGIFIISYRYFDADRQNIDDDMVTEMAPKIQALYKKYPKLDRVRFQIDVNSMTPGVWEPYVSFVLTRKIVDDTQWSGLLSEDFLRNVLELQRFR
jgi:hypothetical protein